MTATIKRNKYSYDNEIKITKLNCNFSVYSGGQISMLKRISGVPEAFMLLRGKLRQRLLSVQKQ